MSELKRRINLELPVTLIISKVSCKTWNLESWNLGILESWNLGILESYHITACKICYYQDDIIQYVYVWNARTVLSGNLSLHLVTLMLSGVHFTLYAVHSLLHVVLYSLHAVHP